MAMSRILDPRIKFQYYIETIDVVLSIRNALILYEISPAFNRLINPHDKRLFRLIHSSLQMSHYCLNKNSDHIYHSNNQLNLIDTCLDEITEEKKLCVLNVSDSSTESDIEIDQGEQEEAAASAALPVSNDQKIKISRSTNTNVPHRTRCEATFPEEIHVRNLKESEALNEDNWSELTDEQYSYYVTRNKQLLNQIRQLLRESGTSITNILYKDNPLLSI